MRPADVAALSFMTLLSAWYADGTDLSCPAGWTGFYDEDAHGVDSLGCVVLLTVSESHWFPRPPLLDTMFGGCVVFPTEPLLPSQIVLSVRASRNRGVAHVVTNQRDT